MDPGYLKSTVIDKIIKFEPENASMLIKHFLSQNIEMHDLIRIALGPNTLIHDFIRKAKSHLGLSSKSFSSNPSLGLVNIHDQSLFQSSPRNDFLAFSRNPNPLPPSLTSSILRDNPNANSSPFHGGSSQQQQQLSNLYPFFNNENPDNLHRRSFSANDACLDYPVGFGSPSERMKLAQQQRMLSAQSMASWGSPMSSNRSQQQQSQQMMERGNYSPSSRPSELDSRNLSNLHRRNFSANEACLGFSSPSERMRLAQQQRRVADQFMAAGGSPMSHKQESGQFGVEGGYSPGTHEREDSVFKQTFLTFPYESSLTEDDVYTYFSNFGVVEDVKIPNKEQQMFGFVTFFCAETVRTVLDRGNTHFIGDSRARVMVKRCLEKDKILQKRSQQQQSQEMMERGNYFPSSSPSELDSRNLSNCRFGGPRMFLNKTPEMLRRNTGQADLQQALEVVVENQRKRFVNLHLPDMEKFINHHQRSPSIGSPANFPPRGNHSLLFQPRYNEETIKDDSERSEKHVQQVAASNEERGYGRVVDHLSRQETNVETTLHDCLFGSPKRSGETQQPESDTAASGQSA